MLKSKWILGLFLLSSSLNACANQDPHSNIADFAYTPQIASVLQSKLNDKPIVLDKNNYLMVVKASREKIKTIIANLPKGDKNFRIQKIVQALKDIPYLTQGAMGEGDWLATALTYQSGGKHLKQDPVYRLDGLDCQTFVQVVMALLHAEHIHQFEANLIGIAYGAALENNEDILHYYNRNNFIEGDFNPVNQRRGNLLDVTTKGDLLPFASTTRATLTRQNWFTLQQQNASNVRVLSKEDQQEMLMRFKTVYASLPYASFISELVKISYLPKQILALRQTNGNYVPNKMLFDKIPLPALAEVVRDVRKWEVNGKNIKDIIGSELTVSHLGVLYKQTFYRGDVIYQKISCARDANQKSFCTVSPVTCNQSICKEVMFAHATYAYPNNFYWYQTAPGKFTCNAELPGNGIPYSKCNRVERLPLFAYLTNVHYGMESPSILGLHIEKLL